MNVTNTRRDETRRGTRGQERFLDDDPCAVLYSSTAEARIPIFFIQIVHSLLTKEAMPLVYGVILLDAVRCGSQVASIYAKDALAGRQSPACIHDQSSLRALKVREHTSLGLCPARRRTGSFLIFFVFLQRTWQENL